MNVTDEGSVERPKERIYNTSEKHKESKERDNLLQKPNVPGSLRKCRAGALWITTVLPLFRSIFD